MTGFQVTQIPEGAGQAAVSLRHPGKPRACACWEESPEVTGAVALSRGCGRSTHWTGCSVTAVLRVPDTRLVFLFLFIL